MQFRLHWHKYAMKFVIISRDCNRMRIIPNVRERRVWYIQISLGVRVN
jgi:hypothetical protein